MGKLHSKLKLGINKLAGTYDPSEFELKTLGQMKDQPMTPPHQHPMIVTKVVVSPDLAPAIQPSSDHAWADSKMESEDAS